MPPPELRDPMTLRAIARPVRDCPREVVVLSASPERRWQNVTPEKHVTLGVPAQPLPISTDPESRDP